MNSKYIVELMRTKSWNYNIQRIFSENGDFTADEQAVFASQINSYKMCGIKIMRDELDYDRREKLDGIFPKKHGHKLLMQFNFAQAAAEGSVYYKNGQWRMSYDFFINSYQSGGAKHVAMKNNEVVNCNTVIVNLVSGQPLPNVEFTKWYCRSAFMKSQQSLDLYFITTQEMENINKIADILSGLIAISSRIGNFTTAEKSIKLVDGNNLFDCINKCDELRTELFAKYNRVILNITGGTKPMSIAAYMSFSKNNVHPAAVEIYYLPIESPDVTRIYPNFDYYPLRVANLISLAEYISSHGVTIESKKSAYSCNRAILEKVRSVCLSPSFIEAKSILLSFRNPAKIKTNVDFSQYFSGRELERIKYLCQLFEMNYRNFDLSNITYINGGWFEEYAALYIKEKEKLSDNDMAVNVKITKNNSKNELDVIYIKNDVLHIVSCKSSNEKQLKEVIKEALNELRAIKEKFGGLAIKLHLFSLYAITYPNLINEAKQLDMELLDGNSILL